MVVLRPAYAWDCPECGRENFCGGILPEMADEDLAALRAEYGIEAWEEGDFMMMPTSVTCCHCHVAAATMHLKDA